MIRYNKQIDHSRSYLSFVSPSLFREQEGTDYNNDDDHMRYMSDDPTRIDNFIIDMIRPLTGLSECVLVL